MPGDHVDSGIPMQQITNTTNPTNPADVINPRQQPAINLLQFYYYIFGANQFGFVDVDPNDTISRVQGACEDDTNLRFKSLSPVQEKYEAIWLKKPLNDADVDTLQSQSSLSFANFEDFEASHPFRVREESFATFSGGKRSGDVYLVFIPRPTTQGKTSSPLTLTNMKRKTHRKVSQ